MTKYKFNINQQDPGEDQINRHKDFKKLVHDYEKATKPLYKSPLIFYKNRKVFLVVLILAVLIYIIVEFFQN